MNKYILMFFFLFFHLVIVRAQVVGVNRINPTATLDVLTNDATAATIAMRVTNSSGEDLLTLNNVSNLNFRNSNTNLRLDLRGLGNDNVVGVGYTTQTATEAGPGAVRYESINSQIQYSDGTDWYFFETTTPRSCVIYMNNTNATVIQSGGAPTVLGGWGRVYDPDSNFDVNGTFTAPKDGIYFTILSLGFTYQNGVAGSSLEARWHHLRNGLLIDTAVARTAFPSGGWSVRQSICYASFFMQQGDTLRPMVWHNTGFSQTLMTGAQLGGNGGFNYLSVVIQ